MEFKLLLESIEKYLLVVRRMVDSGIPKRRALKAAQRTWGLSNQEVQAIYRIVWPRMEALARAGKRAPTELLQGHDLIIDGYNVLVGLAALEQGEAVICDDGVVRDLRMSPKIEEDEVDTALELLVEYLEHVQPSSVKVLFDAPVSGSGELAATVERHLSEELDVPVKAAAVKGVDEKLVNFPGVPVTSDSGVIDRVPAFHDAVREVAVLREKEVWHPPSLPETGFVKAPVPEG